MRKERKFELGMKDYLWFDLNHYGIIVTELNRALAYEKTKPWGYTYGNSVVGPEDVTFPIQRRQIDLSCKNLVQNK